jgi:Fic family protein
VHAQFEIIHPFLDGNGRLGRILVPLYLYEKAILSKPMFYLSAYLEEHRSTYIQLLRALDTSKESWNNWIAFFLTALIEQAKLNSAKARSIVDLYERLKIRVIELTHSQFAVPLLDAMFERPIFQSSSLAGRPGLPSKQMTMSLLGKLKAAKILHVLRKGSGRRAQILLFTELMNLCEARS